MLKIVRKKAKVYEFPCLRDCVRSFIVHDLIDVIEEIDFCKINILYIPKTSRDFVEGIDFYLLIEEKVIPIHITDDVNISKTFGKKGIRIIFLPEKRRDGELLFISEQKEIVKRQLKKIVKNFAYSEDPN